MHAETLSLFKTLTELPGAPGFESQVRAFVREQIAPVSDEIITDRLGSIFGVRRGEEGGPKIMVAGHMDEVGLMVTGIDKEGLLKFRAHGIMPGVLLAKRILIGRDRVCGVIGHKPVHLAKNEEMQKIPDMRSLFIDIGVSSKDAASKLVQIGDYATFDTEFSENGDIIQGKAFDNRIGCYILLQLILKSDLPLYYAFTVQEEVGLRGAQIAAYRVKPDIAFAVDTTSSGEWPGEDDTPQYPVIGKGPTVTIADRSVICDQALVRLLRETAEQHGIPYQIKRPMIGGTDAGTMHVSREGVRTAVMAVPARYIHSPLSFASKKDISAAGRLIDSSIQNII